MAKAQLLLEYVPAGSLQTIIARADGRTLPLHWACLWIAQAASALSHLHKYSVVHRDVKPDNLLLALNGNLKLADFSVAISLPLTSGTVPILGEGALAYQAPECIASSAWLQADAALVVRADVWALGLVAVQLGTGRFPLPTSSLLGLIEAIAKVDVTLPNDTPPHLRTLAGRVLVAEPSRRWTADELLACDWLRIGEELPPPPPDLLPLPSWLDGDESVWLALAKEEAPDVHVDVPPSDEPSDSGSFGDDEEDEAEAEEVASSPDPGDRAISRTDDKINTDGKARTKTRRCCTLL